MAIANIVRAFEDALDSQQCVNEAPFTVALMRAGLEELLQRDATAKDLKVSTRSMGTALAAQNPSGVREPLNEHINRIRNGKALLRVRQSGLRPIRPQWRAGRASPALRCRAATAA